MGVSVSDLLPFGHIAFGAVVLGFVYRLMVLPQLDRAERLNGQLLPLMSSWSENAKAASENAKAAAEAARETARLLDGARERMMRS